MLYRSHRGDTYNAPENTMPAFELALEAGFDYIETDPQLTLDGVIVLMHDNTINRTCRNFDGSEIEKAISVSEITYEELCKYDAGIAFGEKYKGTKVPKLEELLAICEGKAVTVALDKKILTEKIDALIDVVLKYKTKVSFSTSDAARIEKIQSRIPDAQIDYDVNLSDESLERVCTLVAPEKLIIWMYLNRPNFSWLTDVAKIGKENYIRVAKYGKVGIANILSSYDLKEALALSPYMVEI